MPELTLKSHGISENLKKTPLNIRAVEIFAQNMAESIIEPFTSQMDTLELEVDLQGVDLKQEMLAEELASTVIGVALREVCRGQSQAYLDQLVSDSDADAWTSSETHPHHLPLSQSGLPVVGSLDYPDTPPTTPLLPELERSRNSFTRKLKGGLAKEFLPSPPPPTPKEQDDDSGAVAHDPQVELLEHLMHSLSTDDLARDYSDAGCLHMIEAFAEALSCDIINCVVENKDHFADSCDLQLLAHQLAETIITSSLDEATMLF
ncbi:uncharacterized protein LOC115438241 [Sphaeramia orbicularis]|uniref:uncharacterized protein LOC115438241 n=1 Tax=Sphaeramia orbicularis TaxID=375764 RepID=UPI00117EE9EE|nr:uncharacterized protein LOC115438241 [Sphaeramia orbicularis]